MSKKSTSHPMTRRTFLRLMATTTSTLVIASCGGEAPAVPNAPPAATSGPAATAAPASAAATAAPAAATAPSAATAVAEAKPGAELVGALQGPKVITDPARIPTAFKEAPLLADMVKAGTLPPVQERVPAEPLVIEPLESIGTYGGTWRRGFTGPGDDENGNRIMSTDKILFWDYTGQEIRPSVAKDWKMSDDGRSLTISLRKGMKWSDGQPFSADDFIFWYEDIYQNKDIKPTPSPDFTVNGKPGTMEKVDDLTIVFKFEDPYFLFEDILAGSTPMGGGQASRQARARGQMGAYAPAHYLKQFLPKYAGQAAVDKLAADAKQDGWVNLIKTKMDWSLNPELPVLTPWKTVTPINTPTWEMERNPYYWAVDTEGNQLPYIDKLVMTLAENLEVLNLRAIAGEYDWQERHTDLQKLPVFLENQEKSGYTVHLDPAFNGSDSVLHINQSYEADPEIAKWLRTKEFRNALSLGIDRDQLNETFWLGAGTPGSTAPAEELPYSPGPEYRTMWATYDPDKANQLLDQIGLTEKDSEGYRMRTDGKGRLTLEVISVGGAFVPYTKHGEMIREQWKKIGIDGNIKELERSLAFTRSQGNENQIMFWSNDGSEVLYLFPRHALPVDPVECHMGPLIAKWYATNGKEGMEPDPVLKQALDLFRSAGSKPTEERYTIAQEIWKLVVDQQWSIGLVGQSPAFMGIRIVSNKLGNVPARQVNAQHARTPCSSHPPTFYFKA